ncbi:MAG: hypothetical protein EBR09_11390 [Proteobacteria bacterium]|nr:hypothetical protein [Pseudomonadota bacterium]
MLGRKTPSVNVPSPRHAFRGRGASARRGRAAHHASAAGAARRAAAAARPRPRAVPRQPARVDGSGVCAARARVLSGLPPARVHGQPRDARCGVWAEEAEDPQDVLRAPVSGRPQLGRGTSEHALHPHASRAGMRACSDLGGLAGASAL